MRLHFLVSFLLFTCTVNAQVERDTTLNRCPVFITDTVSTNNFFIEARPCILKVYRTKGDLTVVVDQRDQFFTIFFTSRKLRNGKYKIGEDVAVKYSFRSGDQVSYVDVGSGMIEVIYDKEKSFWKLKVTGMIANLVDRTISYYRVRAELNLKG